MWFLVVLSLVGMGRGAYLLPFGADDKACSARGAYVLQTQTDAVVVECVLGQVQANQLAQEWLSGQIKWPSP